ncbi:MAG: lipoyl(octanoyl) transferase LipB [Candidatus Omnitrophica bacterium]|nr:lipoyl(octanoyl) transferase LipB [Candidatus Omnitrophota bacterium]
MNCEIYDLGLIGYRDALHIQRQLHRYKCFCQICDFLLVLEHPAVITLGRNADLNNVLVDDEFLEKHNVEIIESDRGGDVTFHLPGQLIAYPVFDLKRSKNIKLFLRGLEEVIIKFLSSFRINAQRVQGMRGVWAENKKIGSIGIGISKWVSYHGLSINVNCDLEFLSWIKPCGLEAVDFTSLSRILGKDLSCSEVKGVLLDAFSTVFGLEYQKSYQQSAAEQLILA